MNYRFQAFDHDANLNGRTISVAQTDLEYLGDVAELFLTFLHASGYSYARSVVVIKDDGQEVSTQ